MLNRRSLDHTRLPSNHLSAGRDIGRCNRASFGVLMLDPTIGVVNPMLEDLGLARLGQTLASRS